MASREWKAFVDEPSPERRDELIDWAAQKVKQAGMITPAILFAEMNRPLTWLYSQAGHFFAPFVDSFLGSNTASELAWLLQDRSNVDRFIQRLEELAKAEEEEDRRRKER